MFTRNILKELDKWSLNNDRKPLILRGARQVGKTTIVDIFSKKFDQYIYLNLDTKDDKDLFERNYNISDLIAAIFLYKKKSQDKKTLIFIDEIQNSSQAVAMMRYFYEDSKASKFYVIAAGSLLETLIDTKISFPVGRVEYLFLYPLNFKEFLMAMDEDEILEILQKIPISNFAHEKILKLFNLYTLIGGMPEIVENYKKHQDIIALNNVYESLLNSYLDDVSKYARNDLTQNVIRHCIESAPFEAGGRIKFQGFGNSNYRSREVGEALRSLERAMIINLVYPSTSIKLPIVPNFKKSPKLQFLDTGLINYFVGLQKDIFNSQNLDLVYGGKIIEHIVGQELISIHNERKKNFNFWVREDKRSNAELDFLFPFEQYVIPIEVKSGKTGRLRSLHEFMKKTNHDYAVRLYADKFSIDDINFSGVNYKLLNLPYYLGYWVGDYLEYYVR